MPENYSNPQPDDMLIDDNQTTCSLHNLLPLLGNIYLSLDYESPQNFLASPPKPKNTNHSYHMLSPTIRLHNCFSSVFIVFVFVCVLSTILFSPCLLLSINDITLMHSYSQLMYSKHLCLWRPVYCL